MYHYVRPPGAGIHAGLKALSEDSFIEQLDYLGGGHEFISLEELVGAEGRMDRLPGRAVLLTFDDGYRDHYETVFPHLERRGIRGAFFPPTKAVFEHKLLAVNKVHYILGGGAALSDVRRRLDEWLIGAGAGGVLPSLEWWAETYEKPFRYDNAETIYVKRLLQRGLPDGLREVAVEQMFLEFVGVDEADLSQKLYCGVKELREMKEAGHHIGSHGHGHFWYSTLEKGAQLKDIQESLFLLEEAGLGNGIFSFCYPYGDYNAHTVELLKELGCRIAFTTHEGRWDERTNSVLEVPRYDCNRLMDEGRKFF